jgi:hypothetical protein
MFPIEILAQLTVTGEDSRLKPVIRTKAVQHACGDAQQLQLVPDGE